MASLNSMAPLRLRRMALLGTTCMLLTSLGNAQGFPPFPPLPPVPVPAGNPITAEKAMLGKALFWDEQLSSSRSVACGTCHVPNAGGVDPRTGSMPGITTHPGFDGIFGTADDSHTSAGVPGSDVSGFRLMDSLFGLERQATPRRSPTMINAAYAVALFWDGRAGETFRDPLTNTIVLGSGGQLENVVAEPFVSSVEMGHEGRDWNDVIDRIESVDPLALSPSVPTALDTWIAGRNYQQLFGAAFGTPGVTASRACMAVATYMRTLVSDQTPFDDFLNGDMTAMTPEQIDGYVTFNNNFCASCHQPPTLMAPTLGTSFFYTGVRPRHEDLGRFEETNFGQDRGRMKVPGLRNVKLRAPFFHTGSKLTLDEVVDFYESGGDFEVGSNEVLPMAPTSGATRTNLIAFIEEALVDPRVEQGLPPFDHPALSEGTNRVPANYGAGSAGISGVAPKIHAVDPALLGSTDFTVAIDGAPGGAHAAFMLGFVQDATGTMFGGANLLVSRTSGLAIFRRIHSLEGTGADDGWGSISLSLPASAGLAGTSMYGQWMVLDPHAGGFAATTEAIEFTLFD